jgi:hypothetical protein
METWLLLLQLLPLPLLLLQRQHALLAITGVFDAHDVFQMTSLHCNLRPQSKTGLPCTLAAANNACFNTHYCQFR